MAWTEDGFERRVLAPRRALHMRMADRLEEEAEGLGQIDFGGADSGRLAEKHRLRALAWKLRAATAEEDGDEAAALSHHRRLAPGRRTKPGD